MKLELNEKQLKELMRDFYTLSGIRIVLFDDEYNEIMSYPEKICKFCSMLKASPNTKTLCDDSDANSFRRAKNERKLILYHCHAGLVEATIPLEDNHVTIGYLMFGQISDLESEKELRAILKKAAAKYSLPDTREITEGIPLKTGEQIKAAAKIMEACTHYALLSQAVGLKRRNFSRMLDSYLKDRLGEPLPAQKIADNMGISRSKLYQQCQQYLGMGIGEYMKKLRLEKAQYLLKSTSLSVTEISGQVGFADYNYFCRVFRRETGISPKNYRTEYGNIKKESVL